MKKILVPCDFSDPAIQAFKFAVDIANQSNGQILLLHVIELPVLHDTVLMPTLSFEESLLKELRQSADKNFDKMRAKWAKGGPLVSSFIEYGPVNDTVTQFAKKNKVDLIVMGTKGASGLKEFVIGSNTEKIVRWANVPVIAIKKNVKGPVKNIVFPNTLGQNQEDLVMHVKELQSFFKATLHIVYFNTPANFKRDSETKDKLKAFAKRFMLKDVTLNVYNDIDQEEGLLNFVKEKGADMVVMATHGRKGISHLMSGSIAEDAVNHIECPIWTYKIQ
ncbi:MAG: universal stress protein [Cyclobacteriaceae bacterium]|nr:universal stress protein [Cyclobacteriaceae bacterium]